MPKEHTYRINPDWNGNTGEGTKTFTGYSRNHEKSPLTENPQFTARPIRVIDYKDKVTGKMVETADSGGKFVEVVLNPRVIISKDSDAKLAKQLHKRANELCFIANSVNFPVLHIPEISFET